MQALPLKVPTDLPLPRPFDLLRGDTVPQNGGRTPRRTASRFPAAWGIPRGKLCETASDATVYEREQVQREPVTSLACPLVCCELRGTHPPCWGFETGKSAGSQIFRVGPSRPSEPVTAAGNVPPQGAMSHTTSPWETDTLAVNTCFSVCMQTVTQDRGALLLEDVGLRTDSR